MTSEQSLTDIIAQNADTVDKDAVGIFDVDEFANSYYAYRKDYPIEGRSSVVLFDGASSIIHTMRMYSPVGLNEEHR